MSNDNPTISLFRGTAAEVASREVIDGQMLVATDVAQISFDVGQERVPIPAGGELNVQSDWNQTNSSADDFIKNKPTLGTAAALNSTTSITDGGGGLPTSGTVYTALSGKVNTESGKGLSSNDFTNSYKSKLDGIASGAEVNVQSDWNQSTTTADDYIKNKPTIPTIDSALSTTSTNGVQNKVITTEARLKTWIGTCTSAAATQNKVVTVDSGFTLTKGVRIGVKFSYTNSYNATTSNLITLNVNSTGAKPIYWNNTGTPTGTNATAFGTANIYGYYVYDGTYWVFDGRSVDNDGRWDADVTCTTAAATAAKYGNASYYVLRQHSRFTLRLQYANTAKSALTLNINNTGAKPLYINGSASSSTNYTLPAGDYQVYYNGTNYYVTTDASIPGLSVSADVMTYSPNEPTGKSYGYMWIG